MNEPNNGYNADLLKDVIAMRAECKADLDSLPTDDPDRAKYELMYASLGREEERLNSLAPSYNVEATVALTKDVSDATKRITDAPLVNQSALDSLEERLRQSREDAQARRDKLRNR